MHRAMIQFAAFLLTIPAANWMIGHVGTCIPDGPCVIPVWPGIAAPSGVLMIGAAMVLRDWVHRQLGWRWTLLAILAGCLFSVAMSPALALASGAAFLLSELADMAVYSPLYRRQFLLAVIASSVVGAVVDSALFLWLAFGNLQFIEGQIIGKMWMALLVAGYLWLRQASARGEPLKDSFPRFPNVSCSQCGRTFGPGDHGYSECRKHKAISRAVGKAWKTTKQL